MIKIMMRIAVCLCVALILAACSRGTPPRPGNAFYFWRTTLKLSEREREWMDSLRIKRLYMRLFDVVADSRGGLRPEASLSFVDTIPHNIEIVPTVFIDSKALALTKTDADSLASLIVKRVEKMMTANGYPLPGEIQLDYDWTPSTREYYFRVLRRAAQLLHDRGACLSTTLRLHQLRDRIPPADHVALMVYNIGRLDDPEEENSILSLRNLEPWLSSIRSYPLPMCVALPVYHWDLVFSGRDFRLIARGENVTDTTLFERVDSIHYRNRSYRSVAGSTARGARLYPGDMVRHEQVDYATLGTVAKRLESLLPQKTPLILYHLDEQSLDKYDSDELKKLYSYFDTSGR